MGTNKVFDLVPESGNLAGNIYKNDPAPTVTKDSLTEVPKKSITHDQAKASAKAQTGKGSFNGSQQTGTGRRDD